MLKNELFSPVEKDCNPINTFYHNHSIILINLTKLFHKLPMYILAHAHFLVTNSNIIEINYIKCFRQIIISKSKIYISGCDKP